MFKFQLLLFLLVLSFSAQSRIVTTNQPFDIMLVGNGYFGVIEENGNLSYTRDGSFVASKDGYIVDTFGRKLAPEFKLPDGIKSLNISNDGIVDAYLNSNKKVNLGKIHLYAKSDSGFFSEVTPYQAPYNLELRQGKQYIKY